uniref:NTE family protein n=1 Tax=Candidatus Kentrum sp. TUN TaxID=2126343 RepID=A0A451AFU9_9GAMM|nr:MAG: NTE family protein [Candidatus Kentron sp. TUN]VFK59862.1 MAG: NTE family protein [Candidatus Kentron sp. TUN]VFK64901.1 MAG: NTE family protein [Candidatus Kentron sp. TUN]
MTTLAQTQRRIGIALSGGGMRSAAFHAGVFRYLAEQELLEQVAHVSSVSGGSLFTGLVYKENNYIWPSSENYLSLVFPRIRQQFTTKSLQARAISHLSLKPLNWQYSLSRANVLAKVIESVWEIDIPVCKISLFPSWSINGTTAETGRRFRIKDGRMGDYELGYAEVGDLSLASAMAMSAAFPGGIGPLAINPKHFDWRKRESWNSPASEERPCTLPFRRLHLYDGGVYDNLGIEPMFDMGKQILKTDTTPVVDYLVVSDAGAPFARGKIPHPVNPSRFKRMADIMLDQTRALRVRAFVNFLQNNPSSGAYLQLGAIPNERIKRLSEVRNTVDQQLLAYPWLQRDDIQAAAAFPTTLHRLTETDFDLLARHGYETAMWNQSLSRDHSLSSRL